MWIKSQSTSVREMSQGFGAIVLKIIQKKSLKYLQNMKKNSTL